MADYSVPKDDLSTLQGTGACFTYRQGPARVWSSDRGRQATCFISSLQKRKGEVFATEAQYGPGSRVQRRQGSRREWREVLDLRLSGAPDIRHWSLLLIGG